MVISEVFRDPVPDAPRAGPVMLLEGLRAGIAGQLAARVHHGQHAPVPGVRPGDGPAYRASGAAWGTGFPWMLNLPPHAAGWPQSRTRCRSPSEPGSLVGAGWSTGGLVAPG